MAHGPLVCDYCNDPKSSDILVLTKSVNPHQTVPEGAV